MNSDKHYLVEWQIDIFDASTPEEAAQEAFAKMQSTGTWATVFEVTEVFDGLGLGKHTTVDLSNTE